MKVFGLNVLIFSIIFSFLNPHFVHAAADFDNLTCTRKDFAKPLIGRKMTNTMVKATEKKYRQLQLEDLGAVMIEDERAMGFGFYDG